MDLAERPKLPESTLNPRTKKGVFGPKWALTDDRHASLISRVASRDRGRLVPDHSAHMGSSVEIPTNPARLENCNSQLSASFCPVASRLTSHGPWNGSGDLQITSLVVALHNTKERRTGDCEAAV